MVREKQLGVIMSKYIELFIVALLINMVLTLLGVSIILRIPVTFALGFFYDDIKKLIGLA